MGGVEEWCDKFMDEIGLVFTKVDESIQRTIAFWTELTRDTFDDQPTQDLTGQPDSGESGEEMFSQYLVPAVEERPILHCSKCLAEVEEKPSQDWDMRASKIPESFIQEQGGDHYFDDDEVEEDSESSLKWNGDYQLLKNVDTSSEEDDELSDDDDDDDDDSDDDDGDNDADDDEYGERQHEYTTEMVKILFNISDESFVVHDDEDDAWEKLQGFVDVRQEDTENNEELGGVDTLSPESDWVYVTDEGLGL